MIGVAGELAIHPMDIAFPIQLPDREGSLSREPMPAMDRDDHLLRKQRHHVRALVEFLARQRVDHHFEIAGEQAVP